MHDLMDDKEMILLTLGKYSFGREEEMLSKGHSKILWHPR